MTSVDPPGRGRIPRSLLRKSALRRRSEQIDRQEANKAHVRALLLRLNDLKGTTYTQ